MPEGPFERREVDAQGNLRNPIASELDRLAEQQRGQTPPSRVPSLQEVLQQQQAPQAPGQLTRLAHQTDPNEPADLAAEREPRRQLLSRLSDQAMALQAQIADAQLRKAFAEGRAYYGPDGSVQANDDPNDEIGSNLDIIHEWDKRSAKDRAADHQQDLLINGTRVPIGQGPIQQ